jgi:hypothetical protein
MIVQDDDVQAARSQIAGGRLRGGAQLTCDRLPGFGLRRPARSPALVDLGVSPWRASGHALGRSLERPYADGLASADRDRSWHDRFDPMKDSAS